MTSPSLRLGLAAVALLGLAAAAPVQAGNVFITNFTKDNNIFTNLNQQYPNTGVGVPGSGVGVPNSTFLFDPATYTSPNAVAGSNQTTNGVQFLLASDAAGHDFAQIGSTVVPSPLVIAVNVLGATSVETLTNSYFNAEETVTFTGTGGAMETFSNVQLHDFNLQGAPINNSFTVNGSATPNLFDQTAFQVNDQGAGGTGNSANGDTATYGLNEQTFVLDSSFAGQTLQSISITNDGGGTPILLGVTVSAPVPEASTTVSFGLLLALGLGGVVAATRKKKMA